jgi:hypothetical protein
MSILYGLSGKLPPKFQMKTIQENAGKFLSDHALEKIPKKIIADPKKLGEYAFLELLYTAGSKLGFDHAEKAQLRKQEQAEAAAAAAQLKQDKSDLPASDITAAVPAGTSFASRASSTLDARKKLVETGEQDFRAREAAKPEASLAMS